MLNAICSLPNIVLVLPGSILVDRFGTAMMLWRNAGRSRYGAVTHAHQGARSSAPSGRLPAVFRPALDVDQEPQPGTEQCKRRAAGKRP